MIDAPEMLSADKESGLCRSCCLLPVAPGAVLLVLRCLCRALPVPVHFVWCLGVTGLRVAARRRFL